MPSDRANQRGGSYGSGLFLGSGRTQMAYGSKVFPGSILITGIAFRSANWAPASSDIERLTIRLSTYSGTQATFNIASLALNRGSDDQVVFDGSMLFRANPVSIIGGPAPFDAFVQFSEPFMYDPARGYLLVDYNTFHAGGDLIGDFHSHGDAEAGWEAVTGAFSSGGPGSYVTQFQFSNVPEPSITALALLGLCLTMASSRKA